MEKQLNDPEDRHNSNLAKKLASTENTRQEVVGLVGQVHLNFQNNNGRNFHWQVNHNRMNKKNAKESHGKYLGGL